MKKEDYLKGLIYYLGKYITLHKEIEKIKNDKWFKLSFLINKKEQGAYIISKISLVIEKNTKYNNKDKIFIDECKYIK